MATIEPMAITRPSEATAVWKERINPIERSFRRFETRPPMTAFNWSKASVLAGLPNDAPF